MERLKRFQTRRAQQETCSRTIHQSDAMKFFTTGSLLIFIAVAVLASCKKEASIPSLVDYLDNPFLEKTEIPKEPFVQSAFDLEGLIVSSIAGKEVKNGRGIAENIRVTVATQKEGVHEVMLGTSSVRDLLKLFATKWQVAVLVDGNTIMIVDLSDVSRFKHEVAILP